MVLRSSKEKLMQLSGSDGPGWLQLRLCTVGSSMISFEWLRVLKWSALSSRKPY